MKKHLFTCFLASLCLYGSTTTAQVADSPGADFLHRSRPDVPVGLRDTHRSGETRSDTLPEQNGLVDHSGDQGQESEGSSAAVGENRVLIYLELAKKGEPDTLTFETIPFQTTTLYPNFRQKESFVIGRKGNFFEGINPTNDRIFLFQTQEFEEPGYLSIKRGTEHLIDHYLVFPGDSVKIRMDEPANRTVFSGPDSDLYACQYEMISEMEQARFATSSLMTTDHPDTLLSRGNNRKLYEEAVNSFGGSMKLISYGEEQFEYYMDQWNVPLEALPGHRVLESYRDRISPLAFRVLEADLIGKYRAYILRHFRLELYEPTFIKGDTVLLDKLKKAVNISLLADEDLELSEETASISRHWREYHYQKAYFRALVTGSSFSAWVADNYTGDLRAKILLELLVNKFRQIPTKESFINRIEPYMVSADQKGQLEEYRSKLAGVPVREFHFVDAGGREYSKDSFQDKVTVFYFWSTGCGASENFYNLTFDRIADKYAESDKVALVAVNASPSEEVWQRGLATGKYSSDKLLNVYLGQESQEWKKHYNISMFPQLMMMDEEGEISDIFFLGESTESIIEQIDNTISAGR